MAAPRQPTLTSARLVLKPLVPDDLAHMAALDCDPAVMRYIIGRPRTDREVRERLDQYLAVGRAGPLGCWTVWGRADDAFLGIGLLKPIDDRVEIEVGYRLRRAAWGHGYATELTRRLLAYGFDDVGLEEIVAVVDPDNAASQRVIEKAGLARAGLLAAYGRDDLLLSRLDRSAWAALTARG